MLYCFFWGVAAVVWIKIIYPTLSSWIEKVPIKIGSFMTCLFVIFMAFNMTVSAAAMGRYSGRQNGAAAANEIEVFLDRQFPDEKMEKIYPNVIVTQ